MQKKSRSSTSFTRLMHSPAMWFVFLYLLVITVFVMYLVAWGFFTGLKSIDEFMDNMVFLPKGAPWKWAWDNFAFAFSNFAMTLVDDGGIRKVYLEEMFLHSVLFAVIAATLNTFVPCWMAYLSQRFPYKLSNIIYTITLVTMIIPITGSNVGMLKIMHDLNVYDTYFSLVLMKLGWTGTAYLVLHASFRGVSREYEESAKIDGAGNLTIFFRIMFPMIFPTAFTLFLLSFTGYWNDYMTPLIFLPSKYTIARGVYTLSMTTVNAFNRTPMKMATAYMSVLPMLIFFLAFHDKMLKTMTIGGLKE